MASSVSKLRPDSSGYCPDTDTVYLVPITDVPDRGAKDYVFGGQVEVTAVAG